MKSNSQAGQDKFALEICGNNGTYIEIGAYQPRRRSNTYNLEVFSSWKGFSIELDKTNKPFWDQSIERKNKVYWENALTFDYIKALNENQLSTHINYLSCDIEPPTNTFSALKRVIEQGVTFDVITFEHDRFRGTDKDYHALSTDFLREYNYKIAVYDVWSKSPSRIFETWFVSEKINFQEIKFDDWIKSK